MCTDKSFRTDEQGAGLIEYAMIVGLIAIVAVVAVSLVGTATSDSFNETDAAFGAATSTNHPTKVAEFDGEIEVTFSDEDGRVVMVDSFGPGWSMTITKETDTRINTKWTNQTTGEVVRVNGWINSNGVLKTKVREV